MKELLLLILLATFANCWANESPKALQDEFVAAMEANDADRLAACYTADAISYDIVTMKGTGPGFVHDSWAGFFSAYTILEADLFDGHSEMIGDSALAWGLFSMKVQPVAGGDPVVMEGRYTDVSRKVDGKWLYVFDHASMPLPPEEPAE